MSSLKNVTECIIQDQNELPMNRFAGFTLHKREKGTLVNFGFLDSCSEHLGNVIGKVEQPNIYSIVLAADIIPCITQALNSTRKDVNVVTKTMDLKISGCIDSTSPMFAISSIPIVKSGRLKSCSVETWFLQNKEIVAYSEILYFLVSENVRVKALIEQKSKYPIVNEVEVKNRDTLSNLGITKDSGRWHLEINKNCRSVYPGIVHGAAMMYLSIAGKDIQECHFDIKKAPGSKGLLLCEDDGNKSYVRDKEGVVYLTAQYE